MRLGCSVLNIIMDGVSMSPHRLHLLATAASIWAFVLLWPTCVHGVSSLIIIARRPQPSFASQIVPT